MSKPTIEMYDRHELHVLVRNEIQKNGPACDFNHLDISEMQDISDTFKDTSFNGDVSQWNIFNVVDLRGLFANSPFSGDLSKWHINPRALNEGMLGAQFTGTLPTMPNETLETRTAVYLTMFNGADAYGHYLASQPFGPQHASFIFATSQMPSWLTSEQKDACILGLGLELPHDDFCTFMEREYHRSSKGLPLDSASIEFGQ